MQLVRAIESVVSTSFIPAMILLLGIRNGRHAVPCSQRTERVDTWAN